ncbi:UNVERIFIED_CONTAM: hypothetical protein GTU68_052323 [Idotea baltica]|nr:hypothetical protein [Idotea baltica]
MIYIFDLLGTFAFAISGTITGFDRRFDAFGVSMVGLVTAVGGGTLRDVLIGSQPVGWMQDINYLYAVAAGVFVTFVFFRRIRTWHRTLFIFDALGIGLFTLLGLEKALAMGLHPVISVLMGMMSAVFGGVLRDILCSEVPLIFRREIYATICLGGGAIYLISIQWLGRSDVLMFFCVALIFSVRVLAVKRKWYLPAIREVN